MAKENPRDSKIPRDYLKYWRVIKTYYKTKHNINQSDLELLLFMYSEKYFTSDRYNEYKKIIGWDISRFHRMLNEGWFEIFRKGKPGGEKHVYKMSAKGKLLCADIYRKLNGEDIPMSITSNPMLKKKSNYIGRAMKDMIIEMNKSNKQRRRQPPE